MAAALITVRVTAGARREHVAKDGDVYRISVKEKAQGGMANERVRQLLARELNVTLSNVRIKTGQRSPVKRVEIS